MKLYSTKKHLILVLIMAFFLINFMSIKAYAAEVTTFSGEIPESNSFLRPILPANQGVITLGFLKGENEYNFFYRPVFVSETGEYTLEVKEAKSGDSSIDTVLFIYEDSFDPDNPLDNLIVANDDHYKDEEYSALSKIPDFNLSTGTKYYLVMTTYYSGDTGTVTFTTTGPGEVLVVDTVSSVSIPDNGTYAAEENLDFIANFEEEVIVDTTGGTPYIPITLETGGTVQADYVSGSGTKKLKFRYTVQSQNYDSDGVTVAKSITANGGTIKDKAGNDAELTLYNIGSTSEVLIDARIALTVNGLTASNKVYDGDTTTTLNGTATLSGIVNGDNVSLTGSAIGTFDSKDAGSEKTVTITGLSLTGDDASKYILGTITTKADITAEELTATAKANNKTYDGTAKATGTINLTGIVGTDDVTASGTFTFTDADAGDNKTVNVTDITLEGSKANNYTLQNTTATTTANIVPAAAYQGEASANPTEPYAGTEKEITLTVKNSSGEKDETYSQNTTVTVTGYEEGFNGTYGKFGSQSLESDGSTDATVTFTNGIGSIGLALNKAEEQNITFKILGLENQQTNALTITPIPRTASAIEITQDIEAPSENGGNFAQQPQISLKDPYGNLCSNDDTTQVTASKADDGDWTLTGTTTETVSKGIVTFTDLGAENLTKVYDAQLAFNALGLTQRTSSAITLPAPDAPGAPTIHSIYAGDEEVTITWSEVTGATSYKVKYCETQNRTNSAIETTTDSNITITKLTNGITYDFKVKAVNGGGDSPYSNEVSVTPQVPAPGAPKQITAEAGDETVKITWSEVKEATDYTIYQKEENRTYAAIKTTSDTSYTAIGLKNGTTYYFKIRANNPGGESAYSNEVSATPKGVPDVPTDITAKAGNGKATVTFTAPTDNGGSTIEKYIVTSSPGNITTEGTASPITVTGLTNGTSYTFTVKAVNAVGSSEASASTNAVTPRRSSNHNNNSDSKESQKSSEGVEILVNGKTETAATATTTKEGDKTVTTVTVDDSIVETKLEAEGKNTTVTIPVDNASDIVVGQLNGQTVKSMETKEAVLEIKTENITYTLPASQINIENVSEQMGQQVELKDILVSVKISEPTADTVNIVEDTANKDNYKIVVKPIEFEITCSKGDETVKVSKFNAYVERMIAIPDGMDPTKITTGVVLNNDGTFSHVPTTIIKIEGKYYAKINSLTNSTYSVIYSPKEFIDVEDHWAEEAIDDMASRLVINGVEDNRFEPNRDITRAEFATVLVKGLGLMRTEAGTDSFEDVMSSDWYYDAVSIANEYSLISGYGNDKFGPTDKITREQAMTMIARAMKLTGLKTELTETETENLLAAYIDAKEVQNYAVNSMAACIKTGLVSGRSSHTIAPKDNITRAEVAVMVRRLLRKSDLI